MKPLGTLLCGPWEAPMGDFSCQRTLSRPSIQMGLHEASIKMGLCKASRGFTVGASETPRGFAMAVSLRLQEFRLFS